MEETAVFTACFSKQWRAMKKKTQVGIFSLPQLFKKREMKTGTWEIKGKAKHKSVTLELVLIKQKDRLRAVPEKTAKTEEIFLRIKPGKIDKQDMLPKLQVEASEHFNQEELLQALPPGGVAIARKKSK